MEAITPSAANRGMSSGWRCWVCSTRQRRSCPEEEAAKLVHEGDKGRVSFHRKFFKVDVDDPALYHLTLNTARLGAEEAARLIGDAARRLAGRST